MMPLYHVRTYSNGASRGNRELVPHDMLAVPSSDFDKLGEERGGVLTAGRRL
jgi:hypothetical protein